MSCEILYGDALNGMENEASKIQICLNVQRNPNMYDKCLTVPVAVVFIE